MTSLNSVLSMAKSLQLRLEDGPFVGLVVVDTVEDPVVSGSVVGLVVAAPASGPVSLLLLPRLFKLPERRFWKPRRVTRLEDSTESEGTDNISIFKEPTCCSVTSLIEDTWPGIIHE